MAEYRYDPPARRRMLLLASYCGGETEGCTDSIPCRDCLEMCNVADAVVVSLDVHCGLDFARENGLPPTSKDDPSANGRTA